MTQPDPAAALTAVLKRDFRPADVGDTVPEFDDRLSHVVTGALARAEAQPPATALQIEAGARYLLLAAQIRQLTRKTEEFEAVGDIKLKEGLAVRLASVRLEQQEALQASGLILTPQRPRQGSISIPVESSF